MLHRPILLYSTSLLLPIATLCLLPLNSDWPVIADPTTLHSTDLSQISPGDEVVA